MPFWNRNEPTTSSTFTVEGAAATADELKAAYDQGRRDERADRKRHPVIMTGLFVLAIAGACLITLSVVNGSFSDGGEVADHQIATAAEQATPVIQDAAARTGDAAREAGADIRDKSRELLNTSER